MQDKAEVPDLHHPTSCCGPHMGFGAETGVQTDGCYSMDNGKFCIWRRKRFFSPV